MLFLFRLNSEKSLHADRIPGPEREGCGKQQVSQGYNLTLRRSDTTTTLRFEANWQRETERAIRLGGRVACNLGPSRGSRSDLELRAPTEDSEPKLKYVRNILNNKRVYEKIYLMTKEDSPGQNATLIAPCQTTLSPSPTT